MWSCGNRIYNGEVQHRGKDKKRKIIILGVLLILIVVSWIIWGNLSVETSRLTVRSKDLPEAFDNFFIAHISDLHNASFSLWARSF